MLLLLLPVTISGPGTDSETSNVPLTGLLGALFLAIAGGLALTRTRQAAR